MINKIIAIARTAGKAIMQVYMGNQPLALNNKPDSSPVTAADLVSHQVIVDHLHQLTPDIPILSEENPANWDLRQHWRYFWLVDPLDGTKEFLRRNGEFTVNIALIEHSKPIMGVVYAPAIDILYAADNMKAWKVDENNSLFELVVTDAKPPIVVVSRSHGNNHELFNYLTQIGEYQIKTIGSSLKFCMIAEGSAQIYPRFTPTNIWDTAAGHAIAIAAGAKVHDWHQKEIDYLPRKSFLNPNFKVSF
ncbi:3'(2'),5'-bisphosphate nucleotidase CysQ [Candidatus Palibaumannia cicadellinicola]|uniref:3'(2'),5'-bisphosphate nucleotidase CysQ n=2 Tax=cellular organisms TaxID=131567 RepID=Q1LSR6_BAUCH|nr:3'(2'),5'-bisphosphate nucleotidase CysQ [Candidatus Baumannia cicadellinicola]ABF13835.1 3'(2'),5'-bisphosphate nucleotidase [Baumannia cicadellinicola str. Hc (Homalodisca coagulata)]MBS0032901.1 3'(2'),5'-bisphosphate nucleotidase CysQ [Candidatus Baumannia cicadellinicola]MCJ7462140.1 3'(2'),5'-bisphosphate nucleotidase CysQ [Candidatus Baumannia cicadellinicola]MCJ7462600.1 3'(2'),5'-bisphosphate nucleotidase CysQ [Candidatus Baumannia cicadellinicola]